MVSRVRSNTQGFTLAAPRHYCDKKHPVGPFSVFNPLLLWTHLDAQSPDAQDALGRTVPRCTGRTWTHFDNRKLQLCGNELALISFKQNDHITYFDGAECKYEHGFLVQ